MIQNITGKDISSLPHVFLDLDGTIAKSGDGCIGGVKYMFDQIGLKETCDERINAFVGPTIKVHLQQAYGFSAEDAASAYVHYREYYDNHGIFENQPYDGIEEAVRGFVRAGKTVYVATLKPQDQAERILRIFGFADLFSGIYGARHDLGILHKEEVLDGAVAAHGLDPKACVIAGDRDYDVFAGKHVGMGTVGLLYGYGSFEELHSAGADIIADTIEDLTQILGGQNI